MVKQLHKYMDVDVISFLREQMERNTKHYKADFEIDIRAIERFTESKRQEDKTLLWLSRSHGTQLLREHEAFIKGTADHHTWRYFAEQARDSIVAFAVELSGRKDGTVRGNVYELDYVAHAALVAAKAVEAKDMEKIFEDGFSVRVALERSSYPYFTSLVQEHGSIIESYASPRDKEEHSWILYEQKQKRACMPEAELSDPEKAEKLSFVFDDEIIVSDDFTRLEGYVWATDDLVSRLEAQEPALTEDQFRENINFYPVYDAQREEVTMEGHYWLEDAHHAVGKAFILPLSPEEQTQLLHGFEAYCKEKNDVGCMDFLNQVRTENGLGKFPRISLDSRIAAADSKASQTTEALAVKAAGTIDSKTVDPER